MDIHVKRALHGSAFVLVLGGAIIAGTQLSIELSAQTQAPAADPRKLLRHLLHHLS